MQYLFFCAWLISLNIMASSFIHVVAYDSISVLLDTELIIDGFLPSITEYILPLTCVLEGFDEKPDMIFWGNYDNGYPPLLSTDVNHVPNCVLCNRTFP